ncbi:MAG TPA: hypothetical protein VHY58_07340 [Streptosporangiaceae bacterium]|nr:hypothetical protein [Streptosporangiaceae bacterium]
MSLVRREVEPAQDGEGQALRGRRTAHWVVLGCYLAAAVLLTWRLWADPAGRAQLLAGRVWHDVDLFAWFMRFDATAVAHGRLPALVTTALNAPQGINLMWNTSFLLPGAVLAPLTLLAGPQASLTVMLTLGFAGSAGALFLVLRRWGASLGAAALGGAVYGFSPALVDAGAAHYHLQFAVLPPLIIDAALGILTGRGRPVRGGVWLGLLVAAQVFTGEELLVDTAVAGALLVLVLALSQPRTVLPRLRGAAAGLATAAGVVLLTCGYALWVQFHGPLTEHGSPWQTAHFRNHPTDFVVPPGGLLFHDHASAAALSHQPLRLGEYLAYLGWPLLAVVVVAAIWFWRDRRVRVAAVTFAILEIFSLGSRTIVFHQHHYPGGLLPWSWLQHLPVVSQLLVDRFSILADGAAAAVLAFSLDLARSARPQAATWRRWVPATVAVLAVLPLVPLPLQAGAVTPVPAGWSLVFTRLHLAPDARVLVVPVPVVSSQPRALRWQAASGEPGALVGGYCVAPSSTGQAEDCATGDAPTSAYLNALWNGSAAAQAPSRAQISTDLAYWRPAAIVAVTSLGSPLGQALTRLFGPPTVQSGDVVAWQRLRLRP